MNHDLLSFMVLVLAFLIIYLISFYSGTRRWIGKTSRYNSIFTVKLPKADILHLIAYSIAHAHLKIGYLDDQQIILRKNFGQDHYGMIFRIVLTEGADGTRVEIHSFYILDIIVKTALKREMYHIESKIKLLDAAKS